MRSLVNRETDKTWDNGWNKGCPESLRITLQRTSLITWEPAAGDAKGSSYRSSCTEKEGCVNSRNWLKAEERRATGTAQLKPHRRPRAGLVQTTALQFLRGQWAHEGYKWAHTWTALHAPLHPPVLCLWLQTRLLCISCTNHCTAKASRV